VPAAYALTAVWRGAALEEFGRASLFVYWIHVEMAYGVLSTPLHRQLPFAWSLAAFALFSAVLFGLVRLKSRWTRSGRPQKMRTYGEHVGEKRVEIQGDTPIQFASSVGRPRAAGDKIA
jgi:membrane protein implicated in regulation of membrane protease activity